MKRKLENLHGASENTFAFRKSENFIICAVLKSIKSINKILSIITFPFSIIRIYTMQRLKDARIKLYHYGLSKAVSLCLSRKPRIEVQKFRIESLQRAKVSVCEKCPYSEFFWSVFSSIRTEYREVLCISPYSVRMLENANQKNSEYDTVMAKLQ